MSDREIIEQAYSDFMAAPCGESWLEMDGHTLRSDIGYAAEGVEFFMDRVRDRLEDDDLGDDPPEEIIAVWRKQWYELKGER